MGKDEVYQALKGIGRKGTAEQIKHAMEEMGCGVSDIYPGLRALEKIGVVVTAGSQPKKFALTGKRLPKQKSI